MFVTQNPCKTLLDILKPLMAILDFTGDAVFQVVNECPFTARMVYSSFLLRIKLPWMGGWLESKLTKPAAELELGLGGSWQNINQ